MPGKSPDISWRFLGKAPGNAPGNPRKFMGNSWATRPKFLAASPWCDQSTGPVGWALGWAMAWPTGGPAGWPTSWRRRHGECAQAPTRQGAKENATATQQPSKPTRVPQKSLVVGLGGGLPYIYIYISIYLSIYLSIYSRNRKTSYEYCMDITSKHIELYKFI